MKFCDFDYVIKVGNSENDVASGQDHIWYCKINKSVSPIEHVGPL